MFQSDVDCSYGNNDISDHFFQLFFFSFMFRNSFIKSTDVPEMFLKFIFG